MEAPIAIELSFPLPVAPHTVLPSFLANYDIEVDALLGVPQARSNFKVDGEALRLQSLILVFV
jgi:hypothetical protein